MGFFQDLFGVFGDEYRNVAPAAPWEEREHGDPWMGMDPRTGFVPTEEMRRKWFRNREVARWNEKADAGEIGKLNSGLSSIMTAGLGIFKEEWAEDFSGEKRTFQDDVYNVPQKWLTEDSNLDGVTEITTKAVGTGDSPLAFAPGATPRLPAPDLETFYEQMQNQPEQPSLNAILTRAGATAASPRGLARMADFADAPPSAVSTPSPFPLIIAAVVAASLILGD